MNTKATDVKRTHEEWARDWFAGVASCPTCNEADRIDRVDTDSDGGGVLETWSCACCSQQWRIELREAAACVIGADDVDGDWIERSDVEEVPPERELMGLQPDEDEPTDHAYNAADRADRYGDRRP